MGHGTTYKRKSIFRRLILAGVVLFVAAVVIFIASGFAEYVFDFDGYVRSLVPKNYTLEDVTLGAGEKKTENDFCIFLTEVKSENGRTTIAFTLKGKESFSSGKVIRTSSMRKNSSNYAAEIYLLSGTDKRLAVCEKSSVFRAEATYEYSVPGEFSGESVKVIFSKLVMNEYSKN